MPRITAKPRRVAFVTGTRAEFGLMVSTLRAIAAHPQLKLQLIVTGMHLDLAHGRSLDAIRRDGWRVDAVVPWPGAVTPTDVARRTGAAMSGLARAYEQLRSDIVLVVGDRVEAFAAASAAHIAGRVVAHVHGGDRALGQVDDALRHAITKLAHVHLPATAQSARRLLRLGEDAWRIHRVGAPGVDGIRQAALPHAEVRRQFAVARGRFALVVLHPIEADEKREAARADVVFRAVQRVGFDQVVCIYPNNDPGHVGIVRRLAEWGGRPDWVVLRDAPRPCFLGLMRDAAVMVGNSSSGIIEAATFGTPVLNVGPRQQGRERSGNVIDVEYDGRRLRAALAKVWDGGRPVRSRAANVYGRDGAGRRIADVLGRLAVTAALTRKFITY